MSRNNESPIEPMREAEIEQQLKKARPRPVELDGFALERLARATPLRGRADRSTSRRQRHRVVTPLAGSWACGAMMGAVVVLLVMQPPPSSMDSHTTTHVRRKAPPGQAAAPIVIRPKAASPPATVVRGHWTELEAAVLVLSVPNSTLAYARGDQSMSAGMHLPHFVSPMLASAASIEESADEEPPPERSFEASPYRAPLPAVTRGQLLQDLLSDSSEVVL